MNPSTCHSFAAAGADEDLAQRDMELVAAVRAGSSAAFEELQSRYSRRLYRRILSITRNHEDAEDALQETFLRAYLALASFEGRSQFTTWLTRIAINSALMILRRRRVRAEISFEVHSEPDEQSRSFDVCDTALNPEQICDQRQRCYIALRAVDKLHPRLRSALSFWMKEECSMKEVARGLNLTEATVKSRLHRARKRVICSTGLAERAQSKGSTCGSGRKPAVGGFENREQPCPSCD